MNAPGQMFELIDVTRVAPCGGYRLALAFSDGTEGERDPAFFARVFLDDGILTRPNGFDLDSIALHMHMKERGLLRRTAA